MPSASFTLRPNGEGGEERRIIMFAESGMARARASVTERKQRQPVMTRLTAFGPLPFLSGSTSKECAGLR
jgi:hypothetical protein